MLEKSNHPNAKKRFSPIVFQYIALRDGSNLWIDDVAEPAMPGMILENSGYELLINQACGELSTLIHRHTRNYSLPPGMERIPAVHRVGDPIGAIALLLANDLGSTKQRLQRCALEACQVVFIQGIHNQKYFRESHRVAAFNRRKRASATQS